MTSVPGQDDQITVLAGRHFARLLLVGEQGLTLNPIVDISAPAQGQVLWARGHFLEGYKVTKLDPDGPFQPRFEQTGFSLDVRRDGIWVLRGARYERQPDRWAPQPDLTHAFAHYDAVNGAWQVVRRRPDASRAGEWADRWLPADDQFGDEERAVIARVAQETDMLLDAAVTLQDNPAAYLALRCVLMQKAQESGDPRNVRRMGAILRPREYLPAAVAHQFRVSAFGDLERLARALYRVLAGKSPSDSGAVKAVATVSEATLCPPYEPGDYELSSPADSP
jgi:hypothetical protein